MKILVASTSLISCPVISSIRKDTLSSFQGIITFPDKSYGRGQKNRSNPLTEWGKEQDIAVFQPSNDEELLNLLKSQNVDLVLTIAFGKLIPRHLLSIPTHGWLNIHFSKLPKWRGAAPVQRAILSGDTVKLVRASTEEILPGTTPFRQLWHFPRELLASRR